MGMGATNSVERVAASTGQGGPVEVQFAPAQDVPHGGVLLALPALLVSGLLRHVRSYFQLPRGYYALPSILLLLAFLALARLKSLEDLRYGAPGEWGKLLGLDRIPEVRTLRTKLAYLAEQGQPAAWSAQLCHDWLHADPEQAGVLYVDGHVRVYNGSQTALPRHYVARQKLCLRATTDYWINALDGQPFCVLNKAVDPGLIQVLEGDLIPRLERDLPVLASAEQLADDPLRHRFTLVFDREGYSPALFKRLKQQRIACLSYHKYPGEDWPVEEFSPRQVTLASGHTVTMQLAERGTFLSGKLWVRELRKLTESGHQTAILSTDYRADLAPMAAAMFARWSQENFFRYMRQHYHLDRLVDYQTEPLADATQVVNPAYRELDKQIRRTTATLNRRLAQFGTLALAAEQTPEAITTTNTTEATEATEAIEATGATEATEATKVTKATSQDPAQLQADIVQLQHAVATYKAQRQDLERHISAAELPEHAQFSRLSTDRKLLMDTIKMIAYRAETAMAQCVRETMTRPDDARRLLQALYGTDADLLPDEHNATLTVRLHHLANHCSDDAIRHLCAELNATETIFPGTQLRMVYELVSTRNP